MGKDGEDALVLREAEKIVVALGKMFAPYCEVILHDLTTPDHSILAIENNQSGRQPGDAATELGLERIKNPDFPEVLQNYANFFPDGRQAKSTSIGLKNRDGRFIAAICLNMDMTPFLNMKEYMDNLTMTGPDSPVVESLHARSINEIKKIIDLSAERMNKDIRSLSISDKRFIIKELYDKGFTQLKNSIPMISQSLGLSRATVYNHLRSIKEE